MLYVRSSDHKVCRQNRIHLTPIIQCITHNIELTNPFRSKPFLKHIPMYCCNLGFTIISLHSASSQCSPCTSIWGTVYHFTRATSAATSALNFPTSFLANRNCRFRFEISIVSRSTIVILWNRFGANTAFLRSSDPIPPAPTMRRFCGGRGG